MIETHLIRPLCGNKGGIPLSSFTLRLLALITMGLDHGGLALFPSIGLFRCIGRIAFPLYCFLIVQGFLHTRNIRAYARRLFFMAMLSEIPFDLLIFGQPVCLMEQNALFSMLFGLMALYLAERLRRNPFHVTLAIVLLCLAAMLAKVSYGWLGIVLCLSAFYASRSRLRLLLYTGSALLLYTLTLFLSGVSTHWVLTSFCALFALPFMLLYNGKRGLHGRVFTFLFYASYPLHLIALCVLRAMRLIPPYFLR